MVKYVVGIDPGNDGAIFVLKNGVKHFSTTYPKLPNGDIDRLKVFKIFLKLRKLDNVVILIESVHAHQLAGATSNFSFGRAVEIVSLLAVILKIRHIHVEPKEWQKTAWQGVSLEYKPMKAPKPPTAAQIAKAAKKNKPVRVSKPKKIVDKKKTSDLAARKIFPNDDYRDNNKTDKSKKRHDGLVDASLIAWYGHLKGY